ncbi:hypothetical protein COLAER_01433 [Collinsella aerofaciens ATCC 25986]|uniref:Uncharacterized protein n=1 Tax=Collinsella aerofaciens (strain ATCC 25986 / DSM 3979 / JCM 10188 / KCTC 3647 / NCTC 11838 / VPI 1003) TaxID=411903 RepID=A4EAH5_COLAA|nr:hypothetical protein COLAER_01433 [Collinsella aerofaciens ATCC 25986]
MTNKKAAHFCDGRPSFWAVETDTVGMAVLVLGNTIEDAAHDGH